MRFMIKVVVILVVALVLAVVGLLMLPGDRVASIAATQLSKQTGRAVTISPDTSISFYPVLGVSTGPASIASADWAKNGPLLTAEGLAIGLDVPALIGGTLRIIHLEAKGPKVVLERRADGRGNWEFSETAPTSEQPQSTAEETGGAQQFDLSLERAVISDASLRFIDHGAGTDQSFDDVDLDLRWPDMGGAADLSLGLTPFGERMELQATVANVMTLIGGEQTALKGALSAAGADINFEGAASIAPTAAMQVSGNIPEAGRLMRALGQTPTDFGFADDFNPNAAFDAQISFDGTRLALRQMTADLDKSKVNGDVDITLAASAPQVAAKLTADVKGAGKLMRMFGQAPEKFGLSPEFDADASSSVVLSMTGSTVNATLTDLNAQMAGATAAGTAKIVLQDAVPDIQTTLALRVPNAARLAAMAGQPLSSFGLASSAAPSLNTNATASIKGSNVNADLRDLNASLAGATMTGAMNIALAGGAPSVSGAINADVPSTAKLMSALGKAAPDLPRGFGRAIKAKTNVSFKGNQLDLSGLTVSLDQNTLSGGVSVGLGGAVPNVNATLSAGALDFSALAPADNAEDSSGGPSSWSKERIDASALGLLNGAIKLKASSIDLGTIQVGTTDLGVTIDRSRAVFAINDLAAYRGRIGGQFVANNRNGLSVGGDLRVNSIALKPLLSALAEVDKLAGNASASVNFLGVGNSVDAIMRSLSGQLSMQVPSGTIAGIDLEGLIRQGNANASLTEFTNLKASGTIKAGRLSNNDLTASTGRVDAKGKGYIDLGQQTLDYLVTPIAKDVGSQDRIEIPVRIKGPWSSPAIRPDLEAALNLENERKKLEEQAREEIEREKQKLRDKAQAEARKLEERARKKAEREARRAAKRAAEKLGLDEKARKQLQDATKGALEDEVKKGLRGLIGGN